MITVETERLILRPWKNEDFEDYAAYFADADLARFVGGQMDRPKAWRLMACIIGHRVLRGYGFWATEEKETGDFTGCVGLWFPEGWPEPEMGYWLMPQKWGKGYATEAGAASRDYAYQKLGFTTLVSYIDPANEASKAVARRLGAHLEKTIPLLDCGPHEVYRHPGP